MPGKLVILEGSPRRRGNSTTLAQQAAIGARESGAEVRNFYLQKMKIEPCKACEKCHETGICGIHDDMQVLGTEIKNADALLLSSPVYWFTYSAQLKACIDRWYAIWNGDHAFLKGKPVGVILAYGDTDEYTSGAINAINTFNSMFSFLKANFIGYVHGSLMDIGDASKNLDLMQQSFTLGQNLILSAK